MNSTATDRLREYLEEQTFEFGHPVIEVVANLMFTEILEEHSCCDTQTFQFKEPLYTKILHAGR